MRNRKTCTWTPAHPLAIPSQASAPSLTSISYIQARDTPEWEFPLHLHRDALEISVVLCGRASMYWAGNIFPIEEGDVIIKNAGVLHAERSDPLAPIEQICVSFTGFQLSDRPENQPFPIGLPPILRQPEEFPLLASLSRYILRVCLSIRDGTAPDRERTALGSAVCAFLDIISADLPQPRDDQPSLKGHHAVLQVVEYLDCHFNEKQSLGAMAERFFISPYYLERKFKEHTGFSFSQYVINRRIGEAERMLVFENLEINEIAEMCGFSTVQYFYSSFKKYTGSSPEQFRKKYRS